VVLLVQKEVAERICAGPRSSAYGALTIFLRYYADARLICLAPPECFRPRPRVDSAVLRLDIRPELKYHPLSEKRFFNIVRAAFWGRRKTLRNTLKQAPYTHYTAALLEKLERETGLDLNRRGETLSIAEFVRLADVEFGS
jgi:16S rRNA (adenine1518-N6/adenine1519-N6)-dimethyltransferase